MPRKDITTPWLILYNDQNGKLVAISTSWSYPSRKYYPGIQSRKRISRLLDDISLENAPFLIYAWIFMSTLIIRIERNPLP